MHYHVFMGAAQTAPMATTTIKDYDESIRIFLSLAKHVFGRDEYFSQGLDYKNLLETTRFGASTGPITLGTSILCLQWFPCRTPCFSPSWN